MVDLFCQVGHSPLVLVKTRLSRVCAVRLIVVLRGCGVVFRRCVGPRVGTLRQGCPSCGRVPTKTAGMRLVRLRPFVSVCVRNYVQVGCAVSLVPRVAEFLFLVAAPVCVC